MVDDNGTVYMTEDAFAGARGGRGHAWVFHGLQSPAGATPVPLPIPAPPPAADYTCNVTVNVPALASGQTYWVQFTAHSAGQLSSTCKIPVAQSAQQLLYPGNPFNGLADPVSTAAKGGSIAKQVTSNMASFSITTAPNQQAAATSSSSRTAIMKRILVCLLLASALAAPSLARRSRHRSALGPSRAAGGAARPRRGRT